MRGNEERVAAVKRRAAQLRRQKRQWRNRVAALSSAAACRVVIAGTVAAMPGVAEKLAAGNYAGYETAASIFGGSAAAGYIIVGLLAFALGVCVTILCFRLRALQKRDEEPEDGNDRAC